MSMRDQLLHAMHYAMPYTVFNALPPANLQVGEVACVMHGGGGMLTDLQCGSTTVVRIKRGGGVVLANGMSFLPSGAGTSANNACYVHRYSACKRHIDGTLVYVDGDAVPGWPV